MRSIFSRRSAATRLGDPAPRPSRATTLVTVSAVCALVFLWFRGWSQKRAEPSLGKEVEKWEGEGGNVPDVPTVHAVPIDVPPTLH